MEPADDWRLTERIRAGSGKGDPFAAAVRATRMAMIITDPRQYDNPIVFANDAFLRLTGYTRLEVTGRNCRFLQGPETDMEAVAKVRAAIRQEIPVQVDLLNYRKDGSTFYNALHISPVHSETEELLFYFASQLDVSERYDVLRERDQANAALAAKTLLVREIDHRVKNNLQMVSAMIRLQSRKIVDPELRRSLLATVERVEALSTVHRSLHESEDVSRFDLAVLVRDLADDLVTATGRSDLTLDLGLEPIAVRAEQSAAIALIVNELVTNALKHAFPGQRPGRLAITARQEGEHVVLTFEDDGVGLGAPDADQPSFGTELVETLTRQIGGEKTVSAREPSGTRIVLRLPADQTIAE